MPPEDQPTLLRQLPSITELLKHRLVESWKGTHPAGLIAESLRRAVAAVRRQVLDGVSEVAVSPEAVLDRAARWLREATEPRIRHAINATGVILHTGLGRAVLPATVVDSIERELKGCCTLAVDRETGERAERDELIEPLLMELTGAEAATVVNNNAAATLLVLTALAASREVLVSRGQLIEIGGSFRLPEVMAQSGARLVEVGATNRTHLQDYEKAITENTAALMRVHPSNYRIIGFTAEVGLADLADLARRRGLPLIDDLGAGALIDLTPFGLPREPTVRESIDSGADLVLFSGDKLIGAGQCGVIVGRRHWIQKLRKHPLMRALRVDKTCLMTLERTLPLFRDAERLRREHPTYRMLTTSIETLESRGAVLQRLVADLAPPVRIEIGPGLACLGSGSLPTETLPSLEARVVVPGLTADELQRRLRLDEACVFGRIQADRVLLDLRTVSDAEVSMVARALGRIATDLSLA